MPSYYPETFACFNEKCEKHKIQVKHYVWSNELEKADFKCECCGEQLHLAPKGDGINIIIKKTPQQIQKMLTERSRRHFKNNIHERKRNMHR